DSVDAADKSRTVIDPNAIDPSGGTSIDFYEPSLDGKLVAVSLSKGGSESGEVHIFGTVDGKDTGEVVTNVQQGTGGGDVAWAMDSKGFYYTRYPHEGERPKEDLSFYQQAYFHKLGSAVTEDRYEIGKDFPKIAEISLETHASSGHVIASV